MTARRNATPGLADGTVDVRIGISGWTYAPWRGTFFPKDLIQREELAYASRHVRSIEINGTFYSLQRPSSYAKWASEVPDDFIFAVKGPRYITHIRRLKDVAIPLANFFASGVFRLGPKLGPILWQLPPSLAYHRDVLEKFLRLLPRTTVAAAKLARQHNDKVKQPWLETGPNLPLRHALEVRHPSFVSSDFIALLREQEVAVVVADTAGKWPVIEDVTADFIYVRLHGDAELYVSGYTPEALRAWAAKIRAWVVGRNAPRAQLVVSRAPPAQPRSVYVYFDNDVKTRAPYDAMNLAHRLGLGPKPGTAPDVALISEQPRTRWPGYGPRKKNLRRPEPKSEKFLGLR